MLTNSFLQNLFKNLEETQKTQEYIGSGKRINKPSDDPMGSIQVLNYKKELSSLDQYKKNIDYGKSWINISISSLTELKDLIVKAQEIAISQSSGAANASSRNVGAKEIGVIYDEVARLGNTKLSNNYIFAGFKTNTEPFSSSGVYSGDDGEINVEISSGVSVVINISGNKVFKGSGGGKDIFTVLSDLKTALESNNPSGIISQLGELNIALDQVINEISYAGPRLGQLESNRGRTLDLELEFTKFLSETEDADLAKAITDLSAKQLVYEASLAAAKRIIQPSLVDFIR
jgi:flagellar hook-associated protein 3 FlgL